MRKTVARIATDRSKYSRQTRRKVFKICPPASEAKKIKEEVERRRGEEGRGGEGRGGNGRGGEGIERGGG